jgi:hypothetical protein
MNNMECNCDFDSSTAYIIDNIDDKPINKINIIDYLSNDLLKISVFEMKKFLVCKNNNKLNFNNYNKNTMTVK